MSRVVNYISLVCWSPSKHMICLNIILHPSNILWSTLITSSSYPTYSDITVFASWKLSCFNSLTPGKFEWNFWYVFFKWILVIDGWGISCEIALMWMSLDSTYDKSILVQVMAWCHQATSHYLSQCWPRSMLPNGITCPQWVQHIHQGPWLLKN